MFESLSKLIEKDVLNTHFLEEWNLSELSLHVEDSSKRQIKTPKETLLKEV